MDEDLILREIVKSLAFEIEAVNQDSVLTWTTTNGTPLSVKVRVRNQDEPRLIQRGAIPVPKIGITAPEKLRLISSDQTILSFNVYLESEIEKEQKRHNGFKKHVGNCLGTHSDDEGPYVPSSSEQNALGSDNCSKSGNVILKHNVSPVPNSTKMASHSQKTFFGKCKPGGCLDPPFGEDNYAYSLPKTESQDFRLELKKIEDIKESSKPGGCLNPPFSEDEYNIPKIHQQEKVELKSSKERKEALSKNTSEKSFQCKTKEKKPVKDEAVSKTVMDARVSKENALESKYSNSIITYPTDVSSNETLCEQIPNKKNSIKSNDVETQKQSYDYPVSYFVPPKYVLRSKEEERRFSRRLSSDILDRSSKSTLHSETGKTKYVELEDILQHAIPSKELPENNVQLNNTCDIASKQIYDKQRDVVLVEPVNINSDSAIKAPPDVITQISRGYQNMSSISLNKKRTSKDHLKSTESIRDKIKIEHLKSPSTYSDKSYYEKPTNIEENRQVKRDKPTVKGASIEIEDIPQSGVNDTTYNQISGKAENKDLDIKSIKPQTPKQKNSKSSYTQSPTKSNSNLKMSYDNNKISTTSAVAEATIPILAAATLGLSQNQSTKSNGKPNFEQLESSRAEKGKILMSKKCSEDFLNKISELKPENEPNNVSPQYESSSENNEFDVSSEHSIDLKPEHSNKQETRKPEDKLSHKEKQELISEGLKSISVDNLIVTKHVSKEEPDSQKNRTSAVLQKKPFRSKHDLDIEHDDINKTTPLKRNTFTIIASDSSIQKREEIELPENITDIYLKATDKSQLSSPNLTKNKTAILDPNNKKQEDKISSNQKSLPEKSKELHSKYSDDAKYFNEAIKIGSQPETQENSLGTNFNADLSHILSENNTNMKNDPIFDRHQSIDTIPKESKIRTDSKINFADKRKSIVGVPSKALNIQISNLISDKTDTLGADKMGQVVLSESTTDSMPKTTTGNIKHLHANISNSGELPVKQQTEDLYLRTRESEESLNVDSKTHITKHRTNDFQLKKMTDSKHVSDQKGHLPENERHLYPKLSFAGISDSFAKSHEILNGKDTKKVIAASSTVNTAMDRSQTLLSTKECSENDNSFPDDSSGSIEHLKKYDNTDANATKVVIAEPHQDSDSEMNNKTKNYTVMNEGLTTDSVPRIRPEYLENVQTRIADNRSYVDIDQISNKNEFLDAFHKGHDTEQIEFIRKVSELPSLKKVHNLEDDSYRLDEKTDTVTTNSLHSGGYSGLISDILSNISENREGEESNAIPNRVLEETIGRYGGFAKLDTGASRDSGTVDHEFSNISKKSESISFKSGMASYTNELAHGSRKISINSLTKSSVATLKDINNMHKEPLPETLESSIQNFKERSNAYETESAQFSIVKDITFYDNTCDITEQPSKSSKIPANDLIGLTKDNSGSKPISVNGPSTHYKQPNLAKPDATEWSTSKKDIKPLYLDMSFYSYINDEKERIVQTQSPSKQPVNSDNGTITVVKTLIRHGHEIRIPVDNENDITLNVLDKNARVQRRNSIIRVSTPHCEKHVDRAKKHNDVLNKNLSLIYESELMPLHTVIKDLTQEVNTLATKQEMLQMRMRNTKRTKSLRLIPTVKRCGCRKI